MTRLIKKYKNRRLYDTQDSQYITLEQLQRYVVDGVAFSVEDSETGNDLTNTILLQIIVEMESGTTQFLSSEMLRQIICLANHPMNASFKVMMEQMMKTIDTSMDNNPFHQASEAWGKQVEDVIHQWQKLFQVK